MNNLLTCLAIGIVGASLTYIYAKEKGSVQKVKPPQPPRHHNRLRLYYAPFSLN